MRTPRAGQTPLQDPRVPIQAKLAATWTSLMFLYVYVDILHLYLPGVVEDILDGVVWEFAISQTWAVGALTLMAVPSLMVIASVTLPARVNRVTNLVVASVYVPVSVGNAVGEPWTYFFGLAAVAEVIALAIILRTAWTWPRAASEGADAGQDAADDQVLDLGGALVEGRDAGIA